MYTILSEIIIALGEKENIRAVKTFKEFNYWNYDRLVALISV
jgi:hypothetical protein